MFVRAIARRDLFKHRVSGQLRRDHIRQFELGHRQQFDTLPHLRRQHQPLL